MEDAGYDALAKQVVHTAAELENKRGGDETVSVPPKRQRYQRNIDTRRPLQANKEDGTLLSAASALAAVAVADSTAAAVAVAVSTATSAGPDIVPGTADRGRTTGAGATTTNRLPTYNMQT